MSLAYAAPTLQDRRAAFWQTRETGRHAEAVAIWSAYLAWQLAPGNLNRPPSVYLNWLVEGQEDAPGVGSLYDAFDRGRALQLGYSGNLTRLAQIGSALRRGLTRSDVDSLTPTQLNERLRNLILSESESKKTVLTPALERSRALLRDADPDAPTHPVEADALNLAVLEALPAPIYRAAVRAAQGEDASGLSDLAAATLPPRYGDFAKRRGHCWVCRELPQDNEVFDLHHVAYGNAEARTNAHAEVLVSVHRRCHIPQPFGDTQTAHSRTFSVHSDPARLSALLDYLQTEHARYERWIRGESEEN
ncbi:hypothetical protein [Deinococcus alpinitundrae]|uniref:hypothetical protein n=1 Tax=Deinococcus alpinitundrae TaxID=468913 RepID=UPI001379CCAE|nr:hypothetical protein [Deinococcus alpinitundrae]